MGYYLTFLPANWPFMFYYHSDSYLVQLECIISFRIFDFHFIEWTFILREAVSIEDSQQSHRQKPSGFSLIALGCSRASFIARYSFSSFSRAFTATIPDTAIYLYQFAGHTHYEESGTSPTIWKVSFI